MVIMSSGLLLPYAWQLRWDFDGCSDLQNRQSHGNRLLMSLLSSLRDQSVDQLSYLESAIVFKLLLLEQHSTIHMILNACRSTEDISVVGFVNTSIRGFLHPSEFEYQIMGAKLFTCLRFWHRDTALSRPVLMNAFMISLRASMTTRLQWKWLNKHVTTLTTLSTSSGLLQVPDLDSTTG